MRNVPNPESVTDHSFRTSVMALLLAKKFNLNVDKCVKMALVHDLAENLTGDITPHDNILKEEKYKLEKRAIEELFKNINDNEIVKLWYEYEEGETLEAKFVSNLDKIEMLLQAFEYEKKHKDINLDEFWEDVEEKLKDSELKNIIELLKEKRGYNFNT